MATDVQPGASGEAPAEEGVSKGTFWPIIDGGTIVSLLVGWWLYRHSGRRRSGATPVTVNDVQG